MADKKKSNTAEAVEDPQARYNVPDVETVRENMGKDNEPVPEPPQSPPFPRDDDAPKSA